jgi:2-dehydropantoate 2-reductase
MRVLVIGAGAVGSLYAGFLADAGEDVSILARGARLAALRRGPIVLLDDATGQTRTARVTPIAELEAGETYDLAVVAVRAEQLEALLPQLAAGPKARVFLFLHNRAAGSQAIASALGRGRYLLGFPGACAVPEGDVIRFRLIAEQPTTLGEPDGTISPRLREVAARLRRAGFPVAISRRMEDWLKTHAVFVTCIAGAIYQVGGSAAEVAKTPGQVDLLVRGVREGFDALAAAGVSIAPLKLALLFSLPPFAPALYWRNFLSRPAAELMFAAHARRAPEEMWTLVTELRSTISWKPPSSPALSDLWRAVEGQALRAQASHEPGPADGDAAT